MRLKRIKEHKIFQFLNACLLIIGTSVGAGMLGMPVMLGNGGVIPGTFFLVITWVISLISGLLFLEMVSFVKKNVNFPTLAEKFLGYGSKFYLVLIYLLLFLSLLFAYVKGGGIFVSDIFFTIPGWLGTLLFLVFFLPFILKGARMVGRINALLILPMIISFIVLLLLGFKNINPINLIHYNWRNSYLASPLLVTAFGFHIIIPSIFNYLNKNKKVMRLAIFLGTLTTFIVYFLWNIYVIGVVPLTGEISLTTALELDQTAISPLKKILKTGMISQLAQIFGFCSLTTSFLGVGLAIVDFSVDAFQLKNSIKNRMLIIIFVFTPALLLSNTNLQLFYLSLKYGAALACVLLLIIFPALLVIKLYQEVKEIRSVKELDFLKKCIIISLIFALNIIIAQVLNFYYE